MFIDSQIANDIFRQQRISSFPRRRESRNPPRGRTTWIPACAGMTLECERLFSLSDRQYPRRLRRVNARRKRRG